MSSFFLKYKKYTEKQVEGYLYYMEGRSLSVTGLVGEIWKKGDKCPLFLMARKEWQCETYKE